MTPLKLIANPLFAATALLALAGFWAKAYADANAAARQAAAALRPWTEASREQMQDVGACEASARAKAAGVAGGAQAGAAARQLAWGCAAPYLMAQPKISPAVAAQALGYAASSALDARAAGEASPAFEGLAAFYAKAGADAREATLAAQGADADLASACSGFAISLACDLAGLTPDRPERRLGDSMRSFELDMRAQYWIAGHPAEEAAFEARDPAGKEAGQRLSPAYAWARAAAGSTP